jgi:uncharacterized repeat protein (TIGR03803 family)
MIRLLDRSGTSLFACGLALSLFAPLAATQASATESVLRSFTGDTGKSPAARLMQKNGTFYGTTVDGGAHSYGTVFKLAPDGNETVLLSFDYAHGARPNAGLIMDKAGNLYGTTQQGGAHGYGTVFKLAPDGTETVLHDFAAFSADGAYPVSDLIVDADGNLYGTTQHGGPSDDGAVFKVTKRGKETVLHFFAGSDGAWPYAGVIRDAAGNFYGTTLEGGQYNYGVVFKLAPDGTPTVLHHFNMDDGAYPVAALIRDSAGNLYGTTKQGGKNGAGTLFKVPAGGSETVLYSFGSAWDGAFPFAALITDRKGNFYGITNGGGAHGAGTVFKVTPGGHETVLYFFTGGSGDGAFPEGGLLKDKTGDFYGTTSSGGTAGDGTVFTLTP